jgi:hypothetical protein
LLKVLESNGFDYMLASTLSARQHAAVSPMQQCGPVSSISIFAKRIEGKAT